MVAAAQMVSSPVLDDVANMSWPRTSWAVLLVRWRSPGGRTCSRTGCRTSGGLRVVVDLAVADEGGGGSRRCTEAGRRRGRERRWSACGYVPLRRPPRRRGRPAVRVGAAVADALGERTRAAVQRGVARQAQDGEDAAHVCLTALKASRGGAGKSGKAREKKSPELSLRSRRVTRVRGRVARPRATAERARAAEDAGEEGVRRGWDAPGAPGGEGSNGRAPGGRSPILGAAGLPRRAKARRGRDAGSDASGSSSSARRGAYLRSRARSCERRPAVAERLSSVAPAQPRPPWIGRAREIRRPPRPGFHPNGAMG